MWTLIAISLTSWLCAGIALPRTPFPGNEVQDHTYARLLGRQQRVAILAIALTGAALIGALATLPARIDPDLSALRAARSRCIYPRSGGPICPVLQLGGTWAQTQAQPDGDSPATVAAGAIHTSLGAFFPVSVVVRLNSIGLLILAAMPAAALVPFAIGLLLSRSACSSPGSSR